MIHDSPNGKTYYICPNCGKTTDGSDNCAKYQKRLEEAKKRAEEAPKEKFTNL